MNSLTLSALCNVSDQGNTQRVVTFGYSVFDELNVRVDVAVEVLLESTDLELGIIEFDNF